MPPVYDLLADLGLRTTKSVWTLSATDEPVIGGGATCAEPAYRAWVEGLQRQGFEIALHNVAPHTSPRDRTIRGLQRFNEIFGASPYVHANHSGCREAIYWGNHRVFGLNETMYNLLNRYRTRGVFGGHLEGSPLFWGDVCRSTIKYVRNFVVSGVNTLAYLTGPHNTYLERTGTHYACSRPRPRDPVLFIPCSRQ